MSTCVGVQYCIEFCNWDCCNNISFKTFPWFQNYETFLPSSLAYSIFSGQAVFQPFNVHYDFRERRKLWALQKLYFFGHAWQQFHSSPMNAKCISRWKSNHDSVIWIDKILNTINSSIGWQQTQANPCNALELKARNLVTHVRSLQKSRLANR